MFATQTDLHVQLACENDHENTKTETNYHTYKNQEDKTLPTITANRSVSKCLKRRSTQNDLSASECPKRMASMENPLKSSICVEEFDNVEETIGNVEGISEKVEKLSHDEGDLLNRVTSTAIDNVKRTGIMQHITENKLENYNAVVPVSDTIPVVSQSGDEHLYNPNILQVGI